MPILHAIVLGITQGLSEFLPISSSGHLILVPWLFGWKDLSPDLNKTFDVALHMGTFVGAVVYFRTDLLKLLDGAVRSIKHRRMASPDERLPWLLALSAVPGAVLGALFESTVEEHLGKIWLIAVMLIVFGLVLLVADRLRSDRDITKLGVRDAVLLGLAQACALQPGVSRSGVTITMARWLRFERDDAARISFLMSLPIIGGAGLYKGVKVATGAGIPASFVPAFVWGTLASAITGFAAVWVVINYVRRHDFTPFVIYRVLAGVAVLTILATGWR